MTRVVTGLPPATVATDEVAFQPLCGRRWVAREGCLMTGGPSVVNKLSVRAVDQPHSKCATIMAPYRCRAIY